MPYGNDGIFRNIERRAAKAERRVAAENEHRLRQRLCDEFKVPEEFLDLAVRIWWDGKED